MRHGTVFVRESDFRSWLEVNLQTFGIKRVILSQEPCPDYVVEMIDGRILRVEAELFAVNFRYHHHDHSKVDLVIACYSKSDSIDGVPVLALHKLWTWEPELHDELPPEGPLSPDEIRLLRAVHWTGGVDVTGLGGLAPTFRGTQEIWMRFAPEAVDSFPRGRDESLFTIMRPETKSFIKKYHHALIGAGLSEVTCDAIQSLRRRQLISYKPLAFLAAVMDGGLVNHPAWLPTEIHTTEQARKQHAAKLRALFLTEEDLSSMS